VYAFDLERACGDRSQRPQIERKRPLFPTFSADLGWANVRP
jgi:hypothetical protein